MSSEAATVVRHYYPNRLRRMGLRVYLEMARELHAARGLLWRLIWRDLLLRTRVSFLGLFWSVAQPLALMLIFLFLRRAGIIDTGEVAVPYALLAFAGVIHWNLFASMLTYASNSLLGAANLVARVRFPREVLVLAACGRAVLDWLFALPVLAVLFLWFGVAPAWTVLLVPFALLPLLLLGTGLGMVVAMLALPIRDVTHALPLIMTPLMFISPVLYELPSGGAWRVVAAINPMNPFLRAVRDLLFTGTLSDPVLWAGWAVGALLVFALAWRLFCLMMPKVPEYA
jgi:lipopolysaccharide transport system permease protein